MAPVDKNKEKQRTQPPRGQIEQGKQYEQIYEQESESPPPPGESSKNTAISASISADQRPILEAIQAIMAQQSENMAQIEARTQATIRELTSHVHGTEARISAIIDVKISAYMGQNQSNSNNERQYSVSEPDT